MYSEKMSEEIREDKVRSGSNSPTVNSHSVSNIMDSVYQNQYPTALMAAFTAGLSSFYSASETEHNETPPMSTSSSSSPNPSPNLKKKGLSDVINKLHRAASNQTTPSKSGDESTENDESDSQINENDSNAAEPKLNKSHQKLIDLLNKANLTQYFGSFIEQGGDDVDQLCDANELEFKEICDLVGMSSKPLHVKRLRKTIDEIKKSKQSSDSVKNESNYSVEKFLPENSLSLHLPTPHSSSSSASSTASNPSFSISRLFNRNSNSPVQGLLTTSQLVPARALNLSKSDESKKEELESEEDEEENMEEYADTDDVEDEDDEEEADELKPQTQPSSIKIEQNEKMIKKNKVIELYTKGERCVRKLSQLTGVPLTTVYRVIGKLKGINYNIPRGNGAGRKTILDAQDREILVEILNKQPRISRKALGKELEKLTGKSIHNSTLNRELCRLRYQNSNGQNQQDLCAKNFKKPKKFDELNEECIKMICVETKRFGSQMSQSEFECKPLSGSLSANLSKQIIEICQMSTNLSQNSSQQLQQLKLEKIKQALGELLNLGDSFYDSCLYETSIQLCLQKPTLLTRHDDLLAYSKRILENLQIFDDIKARLKRTAAGNLELQQTQKKIKIEEPLSVQNPFNFYTAALALHIQQGQNFDFNSYLAKLRMNLYQSQQDSLRTLIEKNDSEMMINLKKQEELRVKLFSLSMSSTNNEQLRPVYESLQSQLAELIKQHAHLLSEQARLKSHDLSSQQSDIRNLSESDDANSQANDVNESIDILK